ncbi:hypothetical protein [Saccharospirillum sp.]|uniref:hypothetical protein n=1 Tax=Saccharospirillum sp. TaxID=2033801 RepID=UPI00349FD9CA
MEPSTINRRPLLLSTTSSLFLVLWLIVAAFPFLWTVWGSFKVEADFFSRENWQLAITGMNTLSQTGSAFTGDGYQGAWIERDFWRAAWNTVIVTVSVTAISLVLGTLGGYALAPVGASLHPVDSDCRPGVSRHAAHHPGIRLYVAIFRMEHLGCLANGDHRSGGY